MSIINKMLQDLDQRNGRSGGEAKPGDAIRSTRPASSWSLGRNTLLVMVGLGVAFLAAGWWLQQRNRALESSRVIVSAPPVPVLAKSIPPAASQAAPVQQVAPAAPLAQIVVADSTAAAKEIAKAPARVPTPALDAIKVKATVAAGTAAAVVAAPQPIVAVTPPPREAAASAPIVSEKIESPAPPPRTVATRSSSKTYSPKQVSANLLGEAVMLDQQGRQEEAKAPLQRLLASNPLDVQARQMLVQLQLDTGQLEDARGLLAEGQRLLPEQSSFSLTLARLKVEGGDVVGAIQILEAGQAGARSEPQYQAFLAALLLRVKRYEEAVQHYLVALRSDPANASWLVGVGVALEGVGKPADAAEAYRRAEGAANLTPEVAGFLGERLARLGR